jgi:ABC-type uncharacterized transport system permease subunit
MMAGWETMVCILALIGLGAFFLWLEYRNDDNS